MKQYFNSDIVLPDYSPYFSIARYGKLVSIETFFATKNLTGSDMVLPEGSIPIECIPPWGYNMQAACRDAAAWISATYYLSYLRIGTDGSVEVVTAQNNTNAKFVFANFCYTDTANYCYSFVV